MPLPDGNAVEGLLQQIVDLLTKIEQNTRPPKPKLEHVTASERARLPTANPKKKKRGIGYGK